MKVVRFTSINIPIARHKDRAYDLSDLKANVLECVEATDDLYLSFHTEEQVRERMASANNFDELHASCIEMVVGP